MNLSEQSKKEARRHTTDEKLLKLFERVYVRGYRAGVWDTTEKALKNLLDERNRKISHGSNGD